MKSKILENQVRSGQLSSCQFFVVGGTSPRLVWKGRGTQRHSRMRPTPLSDRSPHLIEAAKRGRLDQMIFFSAPLTTRASPTTLRSGRTPGRTSGRIFGFSGFRDCNWPAKALKPTSLSSFAQRPMSFSSRALKPASLSDCGSYSSFQNKRYGSS